MSEVMIETDLRFVWLEITGRCQLECMHCYAESGPSGTHGSMTVADWSRVLDECAELGVSMVQFIGGEPTLHPSLPDLITYARDVGLEVEVFSNLVHVTDELWTQLARDGVRLACSYYSTDSDQHARITRRNTLAQTRKNIAEAVRRAIPIRVGVISMLHDQDSDDAVTELNHLGVQEVGIDHLRQVGRGIGEGQAGVDQLCGHCADGVLAISPQGDVWPCVFSRWITVGNVRQASLAEVITSSTVSEARQDLRKHFAQVAECAPQCQPDCSPKPCEPKCPPNCSPSCHPCGPSRKCWPSYK